MDRDKPDWTRLKSSELKDFFGIEIKVGDRIAKATVCGRSPILEMCTVTRIEKERIYLDNSKVPIMFPGRCINISALRTDRNTHTDNG